MMPGVNFQLSIIKQIDWYSTSGANVLEEKSVGIQRKLWAHKQ